MEAVLGATLPAAPNGSALALNVSHTPGSHAGELSEHQQYVIGLFLSCVYTIFLFPIGFLGNILILLVNIRFREKMTIPDLYFINLAAADLILVADSLIEVFNLDQQYYDVAVLCTFMSLFLQVNMYSSVFFLTWMSFDRYVALARAMRGGLLRTMRHARLSCGLIWMASVSATLVPFAAVHLQRQGEACLCFADAKEVQWLEVTLGFLVPFAIIGLCYSLIVRVLVRAHRHRSLRPRRQKALRMILAVVLVFFTCWLPENVFISVHLLQRAPPGAAPCKQSFRHAHPLTGHIVNLAAFSNSCLNPLVYSFLGETFRDKLRLYLEQKPGVSALNRLCHAALKAMVPDGTERPSRRLSGTGQSEQPPMGDGVWLTVRQTPQGPGAEQPGAAPQPRNPWYSLPREPHTRRPGCHDLSPPCVPSSLTDAV
ncbi:G-protein coupled estrogen receptor 1 [Sorex fumeus]|uniref:G-protein coupled estrogen receptor 1 n=1 Tax=Sorex fumeus TaxID=62283 RepID=UPI0024AE8179|nr:G-protein coupled estrogen receptor 1 [Sorex fumeus]